MKSMLTKMVLLSIVALGTTSMVAQTADAGVHQQLIVENQSHTHVDIYYNGRLVGHVNGHGHAHIDIHDHSGTPYFDLYAKDQFGHVWKSHYHGDFSTFTWKLYAPH